MTRNEAEYREDPYVEMERWQRSITISLLLSGFSLIAVLTLAYVAFTAMPLSRTYGPEHIGIAIAQFVFVTLPMVAAILCFSKQPKQLDAYDNDRRSSARGMLPVVMVFCSLVSAETIRSLSREHPTPHEITILVLQLGGLLAIYLWWSLCRYGQELGTAYSDTSGRVFRIAGGLFIGAGVCGILSWPSALLAQVIGSSYLGDFLLMVQFLTYPLAGLAVFAFWYAVAVLRRSFQFGSW